MESRPPPVLATVGISDCRSQIANSQFETRNPVENVPTASGLAALANWCLTGFFVRFRYYSAVFPQRTVNQIRPRIAGV
jgi:hypothetical protein